MVRGKKPASNSKIKIYNESLSRGEYIYIYICVCVCVCRKTDNNDPSGRNDLLTGQHYSVSVLLNHHQDHEGWMDD